MKTRIAKSFGMASLVPVRRRRIRVWQRWTPYAAVAWSLIYAVMGMYWAVGGRGFPYTSESALYTLEPLAGRLGLWAAWIVVMMVGIPAVAVGTTMLCEVRGRALRLFLTTAGALLAGVLMLLMTGLNLLINLGYTPLGVAKLLTGEDFGQDYLRMVTQWTTVHQLVCLAGGFLWLAATISYARRSGGACRYCGRREGSEGWQNPNQAARWGRIAVYIAMVVPIFYALTRYAWALGLLLGMNEARFDSGQENGTWIFGALSHGNFMLVGAVLVLGLVQGWGEVFPRWMIGLAGRRVPIALAIIPASLVSVLLIVGGIGIWSALPEMVATLAADGAEGVGLIGEIFFQVGPTLLFPVWGVALAVATLGYYYRRRDPCSVCGRGTSSQSSRHSTPSTE